MTNLDTAASDAVQAPGADTVRVVVVYPSPTVPVLSTRTAADRASLLRLLNDVNSETAFLEENLAMLVGAHSDGPLNARATQIAERFKPGFTHNNQARGVAVFIGLDVDPDSDGLYVDVPVEVEGFVERMWGRKQPLLSAL